MSIRKRPLPTMDGASVYRICARGRLGAKRSSRMAGMTITEIQLEAGEVDTVLVGTLQDQAALSGVINTLYELNLPVTLVQCLDLDDIGDHTGNETQSGSATPRDP